MSAPGDEQWCGAVEDVAAPDAVKIVDSAPKFDGHVWSVHTDTIEFLDGNRVHRDVIAHPGAVGVAAMNNAGDILLIRQYRHPVRGYLFELPAGLRDTDGEEPLVTAQRELAEEAGIRAGRWDVLVDFFNSPGGSTEAFRCYLARELTVLPQGRLHTGEAEEAHLPQVWVPLDEAVDLVLTGSLHNPTTVTGVLAAQAARDRGWASLRAAESGMWRLPPSPPTVP